MRLQGSICDDKQHKARVECLGGVVRLRLMKAYRDSKAASMPRRRGF